MSGLVVPALQLLAGHVSAGYINGTSGGPDSMPTSELIGVFVGIPLATLLVVAVFTLPSRGVGAVQYRPGRKWAFGQEQFGTLPAEGQVRVAVPGSGGASARW